MALLDDFEAEYSKPKTNSLLNDFESNYKPPKSFKDKVYDVANSLFSNNVSVVKDMDGVKQTANTGFNNIPLSQVMQENAQPNNLQAGSKIVDGLSGIAEVGARKGYAGLGRIEAGALKILADVLGSDSLSNASKAQQDYANQIENGAVLRGKPIEGFAKESIVQDLPQASSNAIGSVITTAPSLVAGAIAPGLTFPAMFATSGVQEYGQGRESGLNPAGAALRALPQATLEVIGEKLGGTGKLADALHAAVKGNGVADLGSAMVGSALKELPGEELTTTGQFLVDKAPGIGTNQEAGWNEYGQQVKDTALATLLQSGAMAAGGKALSSMRPAQQYQQPLQEDSPKPQANTENVLNAINKANELTKQRLIISNGEESTLNADDALAEKKQAEYDAKQTQPANSLLAEFENEQSKNTDVANSNAEAEQLSTNNESIISNKPKKVAKKSGTLLAKLKDLGGVRLSEKLDVTGQDKSFAPGGYNQVFTNKSKASLKGLIEGGDLDAYLPPAMRLETNGMNDEAFDSTEAYDYLAEKIRNGEKVLHYDIEQEIKQNKFYQEAGADAQSEIVETQEILDGDFINDQLRIAGNSEREADAEAKQFIPTSKDSDTGSSIGNETGTQSGGISQAQTDEVARSEVNGARDVITQIVKRRAAANQIGKSKPFDIALQLAKDFMNGESVNPNKFKNAAILFKNDPLLSEQFSKLHELAKPQAKVARTEKANALDGYKRIIANATSVKELQVIARDIQDDESLTDVQAQALDDIVFEAQDKFQDIEVNNVGNSKVTEGIEQPKNNSDLLGDNTAAKQAIADAERAKDAKRNSGSDNASEFNLTGSNSEADQAIAAGAQDLFATKKSTVKESEKIEKTNIDDFGEKLSGARKDMVRNMAKEYSDDEIASLPLSKLWSINDINVIENKTAAAIAWTAREEIPSKPRKAYAVKVWVEKVKVLRGIGKMVSIFMEKNPELMLQKLKEANLGHFKSKVALLEAIDRDSWKRIGKVEEYPDAYKYIDGIKAISPLVRVEIDGRSHTFNEVSVADAVDKVNELLGKEQQDKRMAFEVIGAKGSFFINKTGDKNYTKLKIFDSSNKAFDFLRNNYDEVVAAWNATKEKFNVKESDTRNKTNRPRTGKDYRNGKDITTEDFDTTFGFRGVQFGEWVKQGGKDNDRQGALNAAYDALMDLANIVGVPPKAMSLEGTLGLAFGARGHGKAAAHFEPSNLVINLTKTQGAGSLAHEWFHALDNYFSRKRGGEKSMAESNSSQNAYRENNYITYKPEPLYISKVRGGKGLTKQELERYRAMSPNSAWWKAENWMLDPKHPEGVRPEVEIRFAELVEALNASPMKERARQVDGVKEGTDGYWSRIIERAARSFENYVINKMQLEGYDNDYLANVVKIESFNRDNSRFPYLLDEEIAPVAEAFDNLFGEIETKETDKGIALNQNEAEYNEYETDLFGNPLPNKEQGSIRSKTPNTASRKAVPRGGKTIEKDTVAPDAEYYVNTIVGTEVNKTLGADLVTSSEQLAQATKYLNKSAVERVDGIVTDKNGKPLAVIGGFKGSLTQSAVYHSTLIAEAMRIPNAANLWLSHNHPSGVAKLSPADISLYRNIKSVFDGTGIEVKSLIAVAKDEYASIDSSGESMLQTIPVSNTKIIIPVIERELNDDGTRVGVLSSPDAAKVIAKTFYNKSNSNGIILADSQNKVIAWLPLSSNLIGKLKGTGGLNSLYRAISQANARSAIIVHDGNIPDPNFGNGQSVIENIGKALDNIDVTLLDAIDVTTNRSRNQDGYNLIGAALYSRENKQSAPGTIESVQSKAESLLDGLRNKPSLNVVQSATDLPFNAPDDAKGAIWRGSMYLVADNLSTSEDVREVVAHELIGHFGMRGFFGSELDVVLDEIHKNNPRIRELASKWVSLNKDVIKQQKLTQAQIKYRAIEEAMAEIAQTGKQITGLKRLSAIVQKLLRAIGLNKLANSLEAKTDAEALTLLKKSELFVKYGATKDTKIPDIAYPLFVRSEREIDTLENSNETKSRDNWIFRRDELGRIQLTVTGKAYDVISQVTQNIADKASFGMATPELRKLIRHFKADMDKAMDAAHNVAQTMSPMSAADRALVSDVVENMVKTGVIPPDQILRIASGMQQTMDTQTDELVKLGMLSKDSAERWRGKYLPRFYNREQDPALDTLAKKMLRTALPIRGMGGGSLKGRGLYEEINVNELAQWESLGWEVRDNLWKKNRQGKLELIDTNKVRDIEKVMVWRDFSPSERESMGENRDALFRFVMGYTAMQNDIALGRMFDGIAKNQEWTRSRPSEGYSKVPDSEIAETGGVKKYANLAGLYVRDDILQHITQFEESGELLKFYRKALSFWKMGKTVLNPVSHMNNVVSNLTMAHFAGVSYWDTNKYVGALRDFVKGSALLDEAKDVGLMTGDITRAELIAEMPDDIKALMNQQDSKINKSAKMTYNILTFGLTKPMSKAYRFEDDFFKYLIYKDARSNGLSPDDAVDYATKYIFNYDDLPKGARALRDAAIPFFAYTYKAVPALAHTAFNYPWRFAAPALAIAGLNALAYGLVVGDDDDDLQEKLTKGKELEAEERKNLPPWMQGKSALGTEKSIRLGMDEKTGLPVYMDISRMIPGGDVFDLTNQTDGLPLPAPIMPSNPVLTTIAAMLWNKDTFTGKEVTDINDTGTEKAKKRTEWLLKQLSPAIAPTGYHFDRLAEASAQMKGDAIETPFKDYTGYGKDGLPVQPKYAALQTIGIKARPIDLELSADFAQGKDGKELSSLKAEARQLSRMLDKKAVSQREYDRKMQEIQDKAEVIQNKY